MLAIYEEMNLIIEYLLEYCENNLFKVKVSKTNVVIFCKGGLNFENLHFLQNDGNVEIKKEYTYLEIVYDNRDIFHSASKQVLKKATLTITRIHKTKIDSLKTIKMLFETLISSNFQYSCPVWTLRHLKNYFAFLSISPVMPSENWVKFRKNNLRSFQDHVELVVKNLSNG